MAVFRINPPMRKVTPLVHEAAKFGIECSLRADSIYLSGNPRKINTIIDNLDLVDVTYYDVLPIDKTGRTL